MKQIWYVTPRLVTHSSCNMHAIKLGHVAPWCHNGLPWRHNWNATKNGHLHVVRGMPWNDTCHNFPLQRDCCRTTGTIMSRWECHKTTPIAPSCQMGVLKNNRQLHVVMGTLQNDVDHAFPLWKECFGTMAPSCYDGNAMEQFLSRFLIMIEMSQNDTFTSQWECCETTPSRHNGKATKQRHLHVTMGMLWNNMHLHIAMRVPCNVILPTPM